MKKNGKNHPNILICMATYNGEKYLEEQLESLAHQTYRDFLLLVHDDGSSDRTREILRQWEKKEEISIHFLDDGKCLRDSSKNFVHLLSYAERELGDFSYYMFCDQDDVWKEDKVEVTLKKMRQEEKKCPGPLLVHTDLEVVDENLKTLASSFMEYRSIHPTITALNRMLIQNNVTGCTMLWNRELNQLIQWEQVHPAMHDWWISLTAVLLGRVVFLNQSTILYRQHGGNVVGATKVNSLSFILRRLSNLKYVKMKFQQSVKQAQDLRKQYGAMCSKRDQKYLEVFSRLYQVNKIVRTYWILKYRFLKQSPIQIIGELLFI